ncbi:MAG: DUF2442 domain-containing protein [Clostridia bacterium]|nr:DUF2442 domain-containing protein [Clostridia bacterium]
MKPSVIKVVPKAGYLLELTFGNGEVRTFDMKPYLNTGLFSELKEVSLFNSVKVSFDCIQWTNELDFDPEVLYDLSYKL